MGGEGRKRRFPKGEPDELSEEQIEQEKGEVLPDREAMSVIRADVSIPIDPQLAASVLAGDEDAPQEDAPAEPTADDEQDEDEKTD